MNKEEKFLLFKEYIPLRTNEYDRKNMLEKMKEADRKLQSQRKISKTFYNTAIVAVVIVITLITGAFIDGKQQNSDPTSASIKEKEEGNTITPSEKKSLEEMGEKYLREVFDISQPKINDKIYETFLSFDDGNPYGKLMTEHAFQDTFPARPMMLLEEAFLGKLDFIIKNIQFSHASYDGGYQFLTYSGTLRVVKDLTVDEINLSGKLAFKKIDKVWKIVYAGSEPILFNKDYHVHYMKYDENYDAKRIEGTFYDPSSKKTYTGLEGSWGITTNQDSKTKKGKYEEFSILINKNLLQTAKSEIYIELIYNDDMNPQRIPFARFDVEKAKVDSDFTQLQFSNKFALAGSYDIVLWIDGKAVGLVPYQVSQ